MPVSQSPQTYFGQVPPPNGPGTVWATRDHQIVESAYVMATGFGLTAQTTEGTASSINGSADVGLVIDGAIYSVTTPASVASLVAGLNAIPALAKIATVSNPAGSTVRVVFNDYAVHTVTSYSPGTPDITTIVDAVDASDPQYVQPGMGVCIDTGAMGQAEILTVKLPTTAAEAARCVGVVGGWVFSESPSQLTAMGYDPAQGIPPGKAFDLHREDYIKLLIGAAATKDSDAALGFAAGTRGKWYPASAAAGTAQVTRGDVVFSTTDLVGLTVDGYTVSVASDTSDDITATALAAKWNADPVAKALATATIDLSGSESYIILTFLDAATHTVVAYSPATADVTGITNTASAVAATAALVAGVRFAKGAPLSVGSACAEVDLD